jgi:mutator protein MutT
MTQTTLCLLIKPGEILLAMKKRGFGMGRWNGYGGKIESGETILEAAVREVAEEIGVVCNQNDLEEVARLKFYFPIKKEWDQEVVIFLVQNWNGEPTETEEMKPQWFRIVELPFDQMWPDDRYWLPKVLAGKKLRGEFYFNEDGLGFKNFELLEI